MLDAIDASLASQAESSRYDTISAVSRLINSVFHSQCLRQKIRVDAADHPGSVTLLPSNAHITLGYLVSQSMSTEEESK